MFFFMVTAMLVMLLLCVWQATSNFSRFFATSFQEQAEAQSKAIGKQFDVILESWRANLVTSVGRLRSFEDPETASVMRQLVNSSSEFVSIQFFTLDGNRFKEASPAFVTNAIKDNRFEEQQPATVFKTLERENRQELQRRRKAIAKSGEALFTTAPTQKLPLLSLAVLVKTGTGAQAYAVLSAWQSTLLEGLPRHRHLRSFVVDRRGRVIVSPDADLLYDKKSIGKAAIVSTAWRGGKASGFITAAKDLQGEAWDGAFSRFDAIEPLVAVVEHRSGFFKTVFFDSLGGWTLAALLSFAIIMLLSWLFSNQIRLDLSNISEHTARMASGNFSHVLRPKRRDEIGVLTDEINTIAHGLSKVVSEKIEIMSLEKEVQTSKFMKATLFPLNDLQLPNLSFAGFYRPAAICGGDIWGHVRLGEKADMIFIGDAAGTGSQASIIAAMAYAYCMGLEDGIDKGRRDLTPAVILSELNQILFQSLQGSLCMTLFIGLFDYDRGELLYSNAGHTFPVLIPSSPDDDRAKARTSTLAKLSDLNPITFKQGGSPLGLQAEASYEDHEFELRAGDKIFLYSDGLVECTSPEGTVWGRKVLMENILELARLPVADAKEELKRRAFKFFGSRPIDDDVSVVVVELSKSFAASQRPSQVVNAYVDEYRRVAGLETPPPPQISSSHGVYGREAPEIADPYNFSDANSLVDELSPIQQRPMAPPPTSPPPIPPPSWSASESAPEGTEPLEPVEVEAIAVAADDEEEQEQSDAQRQHETILAGSSPEPHLGEQEPVEAAEDEPPMADLPHVDDFAAANELRALVEETLQSSPTHEDEQDVFGEEDSMGSLLPSEEVPEWRLLTEEHFAGQIPSGEGEQEDSDVSEEVEKSNLLAEQRVPMDKEASEEGPTADVKGTVEKVGENNHPSDTATVPDSDSTPVTGPRKKTIIDTKRQKFRIRLPGKQD